MTVNFISLLHSLAPPPQWPKYTKSEQSYVNREIADKAIAVTSR